MNRATRQSEKEFSGSTIGAGESARRDITPENPRLNDRLGTHPANSPARLVTLTT